METLLHHMGPGPIELKDGTSEKNKRFWPKLGFKPNDHPELLSANQEDVLKTIGDQWRKSNEWPNGFKLGSDYPPPRPSLNGN